MDRLKVALEELPVLQAGTIDYVIKHINQCAKKALESSVLHGNNIPSLQIQHAIEAARSVKLGKFNSSRLARASIDTTTDILTDARATFSENVPLGTYIGAARGLESILLKDESVARSLAALVFSPDVASTLSSLKKIRRELNGWKANGLESAVEEMSNWKEANAIMVYCRTYIGNEDEDYSSDEDYRCGL